MSLAFFPEKYPTCLSSTPFQPLQLGCPLKYFNDCLTFLPRVRTSEFLIHKSYPSSAFPNTTPSLLLLRTVSPLPMPTLLCFQHPHRSPKHLSVHRTVPQVLSILKSSLYLETFHLYQTFSTPPNISSLTYITPCNFTPSSLTSRHTLNTPPKLFKLDPEPTQILSIPSHHRPPPNLLKHFT